MVFHFEWGFPVKNLLLGGHNVPPLVFGAQKKPGLDRVNSFFFFFFSKDRGKTKQKPSNAKYVHIKKYRFPKAKDNHFENAIDFVWERFLCK